MVDEGKGQETELEALARRIGERTGIELETRRDATKIVRAPWLEGRRRRLEFEEGITATGIERCLWTMVVEAERFADGVVEILEKLVEAEAVQVIGARGFGKRLAFELRARAQAALERLGRSRNGGGERDGKS